MKTIYIVRFMNAYGYIETKLVQKLTLDRYIKNWGWKYNGDESGLEVITYTFETMFIPKIEEHD
ncbi:MAG: hypothetical protein GX638_16540 [Crenarchaeota archaeon]|nr:hypothetical protein [Thermoproteota archaeon]